MAGVTDALDGLAARIAGQQERPGRLARPGRRQAAAAATCFVVLTLPNIGLVNRLPLWLTILVISRDVGIVLTVAIVNLAVGSADLPPFSARQGDDGDLHLAVHRGDVLQLPRPHLGVRRRRDLGVARDYARLGRGLRLGSPNH